MDVLITVTWRAGASQAENRAAAQVVQERLMNPFPGVTIANTVADLGKRKLYVMMSPSMPSTISERPWS